MALKLLQVTIGAAATQATATRTPCSFALLQGDDGNSAVAFVGDSTVASTNGIRLNNSATDPPRIYIGPFATNEFDLSDLYVVGTQNDKVNILYTQH